VDELVLQYVTEFDGKRLKSVGKGALDLKPAGAEDVAGYQPLLNALEAVLAKGVKQVRLSSRLRSSPACLVVEDHDYSPRMEQLLLKGKGGGARQRRVLELNPDHQIVKSLLNRHVSSGPDFNLEPYAQFLYGLALLAENSELVDPVAFTRAASEILAKAVCDPKSN
jgi:molecular chaperone HtpG